jgi:GDP/UDP-N,N'-diacetylbacillosamine 2-epimerase (hydrolysing)
MRPMLRLMRDSEEFELDLVACDMHTDERFGDTVTEMDREFQPIRLVNDPGLTRPEQISEIASNMATFLESHRPDLLMLYGDRGESLAAAMVATEMCIPIAHLQGGDRSGTMDDRRRHAISHLADLHFVSNEDSGRYLAGIMPIKAVPNIKLVGDSHLDPIFEMDYLTKAETCGELELDPMMEKYIVLLHPDPTSPIDDDLVLANIMDAIDSIERQIVMIYPCSDPGWEKVVKQIHWYNGHQNIQIFKNLPSRTFLGLLAAADCIVGNSSCGLIEAPYLDTPCVNVGHRQDGRLCPESVWNCNHKTDQIEAAFDAARYAQPPFKKLYGNGATGKRIINHLKEYHNERQR